MARGTAQAWKADSLQCARPQSPHQARCLLPTPWGAAKYADQPPARLNGCGMRRATGINEKERRGRKSVDGLQCLFVGYQVLSCRRTATVSEFWWVRSTEKRRQRGRVARQTGGTYRCCEYPPAGR